VVYCADRASYDQFFSPVLKPIEFSATTGSITTTSGAQIGSPHPEQPDPATVDYSTTQPSSSKSQNGSKQYTVNLTKYLQDVAYITGSPSLRSLIEFYQKQPPSKHRDLWVNSVNQELLNNPNQKRSSADICSLILVSVFIWDHEQKQSSDDDNLSFSKEEKSLALNYLQNLSASISTYENQTTYNKSVGKLKQNIADVRKILSDEDESTGGDSKGLSDWPHFIIKLFRDIASRPYQWPIIPIILVFFLSFLPLEINPLTPMINKFAGVAPSPQERGSSKDANQKDIVQQRQAAQKFIEEKSVTKECGASGSSATTQECQIYTQTKNKLPKWPELPEPPTNSGIPKGPGSPPKMLAKSREQNNPRESVIFLQQSLKVAGAKIVGGLGVFDVTLENAVKEFQKNRKECELYPKDDKGKQLTDEKGNPIFDGQAGGKTWQCLSDYVQKKQVIAVLNYEIENLNQGKSASEIQQHITKCKSTKSQPKDFIECVTGKELQK